MRIAMTRFTDLWPRVLQVSFYLCVALIILNLASITWMLTKTYFKSHEQVQHSDTMPHAGKSEPNRDLQRILAARLFGSDNDLTDALRSRIPVTHLDLKLSGTYASASGFGYAVIEIDHSRARLYGVGDSLQGNVIIKSIRADSILIGTDKGERLLKLNKYPGPQGHLSQIPPSTNRDNQEIAPPHLLQNLKRKSFSWHDYVLARPLSHKGEITGFIIRPGAKPALFYALGLESGDVVTAIDNVPVNRIKNAKSLIEILNKHPEIMINVERNGERIMFSRSLP